MAEVINQLGGPIFLYGLAACLVLFVALLGFAAYRSVRNRTAKAREKARAVRLGLTRTAGTDFDAENTAALQAAVTVAIAKPRRFARSAAEAAWEAAENAQEADSEETLRQRLQTQTQNRDRAALALTHCKLGRLHWAQGASGAAHRELLRSLAQFRDLASENPLVQHVMAPDQSGPNGGNALDPAVQAHLGLGRVLLLLGWLQFETRWQDAEQQFRLALELFERIPDQAAAARVKDALGFIHHMKSDYAAAESYHRDALSVAEAAGHPLSVALGHALVGNVLMSAERPKDAVTLLRTSLGLFDAQGLQSRTADVHAALGDGLSKGGDMEGAQHEWAAARDLFASQGDRDMVAEMELLLKERPGPAKARPAVVAE